MAERPRYQPESVKSLAPQYAAFYGESILPPSVEGRPLDYDSFTQQYPVRYNIWNAVNHSLAGQAETGISLNNTEHIQRLRNRLHLLNRFDQFSTGGESVLREGQMNAYGDIHAALERDENEMTIKAPTGFGKTVIFNQVTKAADVPTLIVVPSQKLVEQTYERFRQFTPEIEVGRVYGKEKEYGKKVTITTYNSLVQDEGKLIHPEGVGLVILDEVHEGTSEKRIKKFEAVEHFENAAILGFSATPVEIQDPKFTDTRIGKMSQNVIHEISEREAVEEGYLSPFTAVRVEVGVDLTEVRVTKAGEYDEKELENRINTETQNQAAVEFFLEVRERDRHLTVGHEKAPRPLTTSLYASSVAHAQELASKFQQAGVKAAAVWGEQPAQEREEILRQWEAGEIEVVCSKDLLVRGIDIPGIRLVMNVAPTMSEIVEKQRSGRGLRLDPNNSDKHAIIADFVYENANKRYQQVTYPQLLDAAQITRKKIDSQSASGGEGRLPKLNDIDIEGLRIISNPEEIMRITRRMMEAKYGPAPEGWMVVGSSTNKSGIAGALGKSQNWVDSHIPDVIVQIQREQETLGIPIDEQPPLAQEFLDKAGHINTYYAPIVLEYMQKLTEQYQSVPEGWLVAGFGKKGIAGELGKGQKWVADRLAKAITEIQREQEAEGIPLDEQPPLVQKFRSERGHINTYYAPIVLERLREMAGEIDQLPPKGWMSILGKSGIVDALGKSENWIKIRLPKVITQIQKGQEATGIPLDQQESLFGEYITKTGGISTYYSSQVIEGLRKMAEAEQPPPAGWMVVGAKGKGISGELKRTPPWIRAHLPEAITEIQREQEAEGIPLDKQPPLFGKYITKTGVSTYYSPRVIEKLREML